MHGKHSLAAVPEYVPAWHVSHLFPDPHPHSTVRNVWCEAIAVAMCKFNRLVMYDGRRLHNQFFEPAAYDRLTLDPLDGRLTMNSFFWQGGQPLDEHGLPQDVARKVLVAPTR